MEKVIAEKQEVIPQLDAHMCMLAEQERNIYIVTIDAGVTRKQVLNPLFWAHVAPKFTPYTKIELRSHDGSLFAELLVTQAERTWARVHVLSWHDLTTRDVALSQADVVKATEDTQAKQSEFEVVQKGPVKKWCVVNNKTNPPTMVREGEPSKKAAQDWLDGYVRVITA